MDDRRIVVVEKSRYDDGVEVRIYNNGYQGTTIHPQSDADLRTVVTAINLYLENKVPVTMDIVGYPDRETGGDP